MEVTENALEPMEDSSTSSSGEEEESGGQEDMEGSDQEEEEEKAANPAFSKFMQGFWDLASVDVPVRCVACPNTTPPSLNQVFFGLMDLLRLCLIIRWSFYHSDSNAVCLPLCVP